MFPVTPKGKRITHSMFGHDADRPLVLFEDAEWKPVGLHSARSAKAYWDYTTESHVFPRADELVRIAFFFKIGFYPTLALVLKGEWEHFIAEKKVWPKNGNLSDIIRDENVSQQFKGAFHPDTKALFHSLNDARYGRQCDAVNLDQNGFNLLVREMILKDLHRVNNNGLEIEKFIEGVEAEREMLRADQAKDQEAFYITKAIWMELHEDLGEQLLLLGNIRLENAQLVQRWRLVFGKYELALEEALAKGILLERRIELRRNFPELRAKELDEKMNNLEEQMREELTDLSFRVKSAPWFMKERGEGKVDEEELANTIRECKRVWRELWFLLHPDRLNSNPAYRSLTEEQKQYLAKLGKNLTEIKPEQLGYRREQIGYDNWQLHELLGIQATAKKILESAGFNTDIRLIIEGKSRSEQMAWLEKEIKLIKSDIQKVKAEIIQETSDEETMNKKEMLACPEQYEEIIEKMAVQTKQEEEKAARLAQHLEALLNDKEDERKKDEIKQDETKEAA